MSRKETVAIRVAECVGCGYCCMKAPCVASSRLYPGVKYCPQLVWSDDLGRYLCHLSMLPGAVGERYRNELSIGAGCCSSLNTWRRDVRRRNVLEANPMSNPLPSEFQLFLGVLGNQWITSDVLALTLYTLHTRLQSDLHYTEEEATRYIEHIERLFNENRRSYVKDFMG